MNQIEGDSNLPPPYGKATAELDPAAVLHENAMRLRKFLIHCLSIDYSATSSTIELSSEDIRFFMRLSQYVIWHERNPGSAFTSLDHCDPALEHQALVNILISDPARYLGVPIAPVKWMIMWYIWCMDTRRSFKGRWNGDVPLSLDLIANKLLLDKELMIDAVLHNYPNPQLQTELHVNLDKIQNKCFISLTSVHEYVPTELGERHNSCCTGQQEFMVSTKFSPSRDFLDSFGERVGLLRYLNAVKTDRTC